MSRGIRAIVIVTLTACASGGAPGATPGSAATAAVAAPRARQDQQLITRDVILGTQYTNLYDVVQALRGNWLRQRVTTSASGKVEVLVVYLDNQRIGGVEELRRIVPTNVSTARYFDPITASARWGLDHGAGAIYIVTQK